MLLLGDDCVDDGVDVTGTWYLVFDGCYYCILMMKMMMEHGTWNMGTWNYYDDEDDNGFSYTCNNMILFHIIMMYVHNNIMMCVPKNTLTRVFTTCHSSNL